MPRVRFEVEFPSARSVCLAGDFNGWDPSARRMKRVRKGQDVFVAVMDLGPGSHQFKYVVDGEWVCCPNSDRATTDDGFENSVVVVAGE